MALAAAGRKACLVELKGLWPWLLLDVRLACGQSCTPKVVPGAAPAWLRLRPGSADIYIYYEFTYISYIDIHMYVYVLFIYIYIMHMTSMCLWFIEYTHKRVIQRIA